MRELDKMISGELYDAGDIELVRMRTACQTKCFTYNNLPPSDIAARELIISDLVNSPSGIFYVEQPFKCDYGFNITIGKNFYSNYNLVILDCNKVTIGDDVLIAPNVGIYTATHPVNARMRCDGGEYGLPIVIKDRCWIGANAIILPGVTIGKECVIGAGSVVTRDVPDGAIVAGNPARVIGDAKVYKEKYKQ